MNLLKQADALKGTAELESHLIDTILTDPPYWLGSRFAIDPAGQYVGKTTDCKHTGKTWHTGDGYWVEKLLAQFFRVLKYGGFALVFSSDRTSDLVTYNARKVGFEVCQTIYWRYPPGMPKGTDARKRAEALLLQGSASTRALRQQEYANPTGEEIAVRQGSNGFSNDVQTVQRKTGTAPMTDLGRKIDGARYGLACLAPEIEPILVFRKPAKHPSIAEDVVAFEDDKEIHPPLVFVEQYRARHGRFPGQVLEIPKPGREERLAYPHPTLKPVALMDELVLLFSRPGDTILDPFCGSGTTLQAANRHGRQWIGFDVDESYFSLAMKRVGLVEAA